MIVRIPSGCGELFYHNILRRIAGISHSQVDHIGAGATFLVKEFIDPRKQIRRQTEDAIRHRDAESGPGFRGTDRTGDFFRQIFLVHMLSLPRHWAVENRIFWESRGSINFWPFLSVY